MVLKRAREAGQLVVAHHVHALRGVEVAAELLGAAGEAGYRHQRGARDQRAEAHAERDAHGAQHDQRHQQVVELVVHLVERAGDLHRAPAGRGLGEHPHVGAVHLPVLEVTALPRPRHLLRAFVDGQLPLVTGRAQDLAGGGHELGDARGASEASHVRPQPLDRRGADRLRRSAARPAAARRPFAHLVGTLRKRRVDLAAQGRAHREVGEHGRGQDRHGHRQARHGGDAGAQCHGSLSA